MSVLIRGMEMPTTPVLFCIHPDGKVFADMEGLWKEYSAVPVPPHGDLIERDALTISTAVPLDGKPYQYVHFLNIKGAPTIIPAEEVEHGTLYS